MPGNLAAIVVMNPPEPVVRVVSSRHKLGRNGVFVKGLSRHSELSWGVDSRVGTAGAKGGEPGRELLVRLTASPLLMAAVLALL